MADIAVVGTDHNSTHETNLIVSNPNADQLLLSYSEHSAFAGLQSRDVIRSEIRQVGNELKSLRIAVASSGLVLDSMIVHVHSSEDDIARAVAALLPLQNVTVALLSPATNGHD